MKYLVALLFLSQATYADPGTDRESGLFLGAGLGIGQSVFSPQSGNPPAKFNTQGYVFEGGISFALAGRFGLQVSGELGQSSSTNGYATESYMETGSLNYYSGKAGFFYGPVTLGGGTRRNEVSIKSLSLAPHNYQESNYTGWTPILYGNYSLDIKKRFRAVVEAQYVAGKLSGSAPSTASVKLSDTSLGLRVFFLFD